MSRKDDGPDNGRPGALKEARARAKRRWPLPRLILLFGAIFLALGLGLQAYKQSTRPSGSGTVGSSGTAQVGGPFRLVDQNGRAANESLLQGRWTAMFFGYTYCPDVCPATLSALKVVKDQLGPKAQNLQVVFVTIDPERDTPAQLKSYLSTPAFPQPIVGLTGAPDQIAAMAKAYRVYYAKSGTGKAYLMDHASGIYLIDPKGRFYNMVSDQEGLDAMADRIGAALSRG